MRSAKVAIGVRGLGVLLAAAMLAACGAETAGTAVTAGALKAQEGEQARRTTARVEARLDAALSAQEARLEAARAAGDR